MSRELTSWGRTQRILSRYATVPLRLIVGYGFLAHGIAKWNKGPDAFAAKLMKIVDGRAQFGPPGYECDLLYIACIVTLVLSAPSPWSIDAYRLRKGGGTLD
jgi:uncharacterized membrane protein YphA (DoxX/SURF4 family)